MPTLTQYRQQAARGVHPYWSGTATSGSTVSVLEMAVWPYLSNLDQDDLFADYFLFRPNAQLAGDMVRSVATYVPSTGKFVPDKDWQNAPFTGGAGETIELHGVIEPKTQLTLMVNDALKDLMVVTEFSISTTGNVQRQLLNRSQSWLTEPKWVRQLGLLTASDDRNQFDPYQVNVRGEVEKIGDQVWLVHPGYGFNDGDRLYVKCIKPAYHHCRPTNGTWGDQDGLSLESDEAVPQLDWLAAKMRVLAWEQYDLLLAPGDEQRIKRERADAAELFGSLTEQYLDVPTYSYTPLIQWGPPH